MSKVRGIVAALPLIAAAGVALGQVSPIPLELIPCSGYALDVPPPPAPGYSERFCHSFQAVAGEQIQSTCAAHGVASGIQYGMGCLLLIGPLDGSAFAVQASATEGATATVSYTIPQTGSYLLETIYTGNIAIFADLNLTLDLVSLPCVGDAASLCVTDSRFRITAEFQQTPEGPSSQASPVPLTSDTGYFWFFDAANVEIVTKVLNGCAANGHYWFFAGGLTNVGVQIRVKDALSGVEQTYSSPVGTPFAPVQDTTAFATCP